MLHAGNTRRGVTFVLRFGPGNDQLNENRDAVVVMVMDMSQRVMLSVTSIGSCQISSDVITRNHMTLYQSQGKSSEGSPWLA